MSFDIVNSKSVCKDNGRFLLTIGFREYNLGIQICQNISIILMLIFWHICIHPRRKK